MRPGIQKFATQAPLFECPFCSNPLELLGSSLACSNGHTFDVNRRGYVDLRKKVSHSAHYTQEFFEARLAAMQKGLYSHLIDQLMLLLSDKGLEASSALDVGCGDGFITRKLGVGTGLDISLEGIKVAARGGGFNRWVCGDAAHLPMVDGSFSWILNVFSPAEYAEFARVCPSGIVVKVVPGPSHMHELRSLVGLGESTQDSATVLFKRHMRDVETYDIVQTTPLTTQESKRVVIQMSPVAFDRELSEEDSQGWKDLENITTHSMVLVGRLP